MLRLTSYQPDDTGLDHWNYATLEGLPTNEVKFWLASIRMRLIDDLHLQYYDAVELYGLDGFIDHLISGANQPALAWEAGMLYATLDFSKAQLFLPSSPSALGRHRSGLFLDYLRQRARDNLHTNIYPLLYALAVASRLPDEWFPREDLEKRIQEMVCNISIYQKPDVQLSLALQPGGLRWMEVATRQALDQALSLLQAGQPVIFRLVRSLKNLAENRQVIAYGWQDLPAIRNQDGNGYLFHVYEPACILNEHALLVDFRGKKPRIDEICSEKTSLPVLGFLIDQYVPGEIPPDLIPPLLRRMWIRRLVYRVKRFLQRIRRE
jgi:hypothetical protein